MHAWRPGGVVRKAERVPAGKTSQKMAVASSNAVLSACEDATARTKLHAVYHDNHVH